MHMTKDKSMTAVHQLTRDEHMMTELVSWMDDTDHRWTDDTNLSHTKTDNGRFSESREISDNGFIWLTTSW